MSTCKELQDLSEQYILYVVVLVYIGAAIV